MTFLATASGLMIDRVRSSAMFLYPGIKVLAKPCIVSLEPRRACVNGAAYTGRDLAWEGSDQRPRRPPPPPPPPPYPPPPPPLPPPPNPPPPPPPNPPPPPPPRLPPRPPPPPPRLPLR